MSETFAERELEAAFDRDFERQFGFEPLGSERADEGTEGARRFEEAELAAMVGLSVEELL